MTIDEAEPAMLRIVHFSDTHLTGDGSLHYGTVDTAAALARVLDRLAPLTSVDLVVASGDLSDDGSAASYRAVRGLVGPWAAARGAEVCYAIGNHDGRAGFEAEIGPRTGMTTVRGVRVLHLDSQVPGRGYGEVGGEQLDWLRDTLAEPVDEGTVVVLHHPPIAAFTPLLAALELSDRDDLLDAVAGTDVRMVLAGHFHHGVATEARGVPIVVAPGITNTTDLTAAAGHERAVIGSGAVLVDLPVGAAARTADGWAAPTVRFVTAPSPADGTEVFDLDPDRVAAVAASAGRPDGPDGR